MPRRANDTWLGSVGRKLEGEGRKRSDFNETSVNGTQRFNSSSALSSLWDWAVGSGEGETMDYGNSSDLGYSWNSTSPSASSYTSPASYSSSSPSKYETVPASSAPSSTSSYPSFWFPSVGGGGDVAGASSTVSAGFVPQDLSPSFPPSSSPNASSPLFLLLDFGGASSASSASAAASVSPTYASAPSDASAAGPGGHAGVPTPSAAPSHSPSSHSPGANGTATGVAVSSVTSSPAAGILLMLPSPWNESAAVGNATLPGWDSEEERNLWALLLVLFPLFTLFGNVLVILSVHRERALQTVTNYFIVSLALADLLVAVLVMPFAVYVLVNGTWGLPTFVCDFYIAMDVTCSTSSIFNLVAISIDRYIAVTQPIKYAKHKSQRRVWLTIALVWVISAAIGSPIVLGLNNTPERLPDLCLFYNSDFIIYSSLSSFYIPCIIMVFLYYNIFKALRTRARRAKAARRPNMASSAMKTGTVIENLAQTRRLAETALGGAGGPLPLPLPVPISGGGSGGGSGPGSIAQSSAFDEDKPTNTGSGSQEEEDEEDDEEEEEEEEERDGGLEHSLPFDEEEDDCDGCHVIPNDKSTEFILATVTAERRRRRQRQQQQTLAAAGVMVGSAALAGTNGRRLRSPAASPTGPPIVTASAAAPVVACGIVVATAVVGGDDTVPVGGNHDSGYAASNVVDEEGGLPHAACTPKEGDAAEGEAGAAGAAGADAAARRSKKRRPLLALHRNSDDEKSKSKAKKNGVILEAKPQAVREADGAKGAKKGMAGSLAGAVLPSQGMGAAAAAASAAGVGLSAAVASKKERKSGSRFTIYKVHKASRKKREKSSAKKERKATKTLAIVLGVFLFCWVPFFTCNIMDAICTKIGSDCQPGVTAFILTTWLGYMNSFVNPVIYTIFNPEFRKAFKKLMSVGT